MNLKPVLATVSALLLTGAIAFAAPDDDPFVYSTDDNDSELLSDAWANVQEDGGEALDAAAAINDPQMTTEQKLEELVTPCRCGRSRKSARLYSPEPPSGQHRG